MAQEFAPISIKTEYGEQSTGIPEVVILTPQPRRFDFIESNIIVDMLANPGASATVTELAEAVYGKKTNDPLKFATQLEEVHDTIFDINTHTEKLGDTQVTIAAKTPEGQTEPRYFFATKKTEPIVLYEGTPYKRTEAMKEVEQKFGLPGETIRDLLIRLYWGNKYGTKQHSIEDLVKLFGKGRSTIRGWMNTHHIPRRTHKEAGALVAQTPEKINYVVTQAHTEEANEKRRNKSEKIWKQWRQEGKPFQKYNQQHEEKARLYEKRVLGPDPKEKLQGYVDMGWSNTRIAKELGTSDYKVGKWLKKYGLTSNRNKGRIRVSEKQIRLVTLAQTQGLLNQLPSRQADILRLRYIQHLTGRVVAEQFGITRQQVSNIEKEAFANLKKIKQQGKKHK